MKKNTKPVNKTHSIAEVAFVFQFASDFIDADINRVMSLKHILKDQLPNMEPIQAIGIQLQGGSVNPPNFLPAKLMGVSFSCFGKDGSVEKLLKIEKNMVVVNVMTYTRWSAVWDEVRNYLQLVAEKISGPENQVVTIGLTYIDRFVYEGKAMEYRCTDVFNEASEFLTSRAFKAGPYWHVHQGWFEPSEVAPRCLNILNINSADAGNEHHTTIEHRGVFQFLDPISNIKSMFFGGDDESSKESKIDQFFTKLHENNKEVLLKTLSKEMIKEIQLEG